MRILLAGTGSGCGKTTAALVLMAALRGSGLTVAPCKVGPDYIDPGFHAAVCGRPSYNLDTFLMGEGAIRRALSRPADICVIEGVMGYYDGLDASLAASTWEVAHRTGTPVLLVVDASGGAASVAATALGFLKLRADSGIAGVLVNRCSGESHYNRVREAVERYTGLPCAGWLPRFGALRLSSRHLGLVPACEVQNVAQRARQAAKEAEGTLDLPRVLSIAAAAEPVEAPAAPGPAKRPGLRIGVARDEAFHFYYEANLDALREAGAQLVFFSPLHDAALPQNLDALYIGGGFPEVFRERLAANRGMRESIRRALEGGLRCYAECGGLLYLSRELDGAPMAGFLPARCRMTERLQRFGYVWVEERTGLRFPAHEFHHALAEAQAGARLCYTVTKASDPAKSWTCGFERGNTLAAFAHVFFADRPELMRRFFGL